MVKGKLVLDHTYDCLTLNEKNKVRHIREVIKEIDDKTGEVNITKTDRYIRFTRQSLTEIDGTYYFISDLNKTDVEEYMKLIYKYYIKELEIEELDIDGGS